MEIVLMKFLTDICLQPLLRFESIPVRGGAIRRHVFQSSAEHVKEELGRKTGLVLFDIFHTETYVLPS
jgi:hypothetical protein